MGDIMISMTGKDQCIAALMNPMNDQWSSYTRASIDTGRVCSCKDQWHGQRNK